MALVFRINLSTASRLVSGFPPSFHHSSVIPPMPFLAQLFNWSRVGQPRSSLHESNRTTFSLRTASFFKVKFPEMGILLDVLNHVQVDS